jgi:hypothetical protein
MRSGYESTNAIGEVNRPLGGLLARGNETLKSIAEIRIAGGADAT